MNEAYVDPARAERVRLLRKAATLGLRYGMGGARFRDYVMPNLGHPHDDAIEVEATVEIVPPMRILILDEIGPKDEVIDV